MPQKLCACGCGKAVAASRHFFRGHKPHAGATPPAPSSSDGVSEAIEYVALDEFPLPLTMDPEYIAIYRKLMACPAGKAVKAPVPGRLREQEPRHACSAMRAAIKRAAVNFGAPKTADFSANVLRVAISNGFIFVARNDRPPRRDE